MRVLVVDQELMALDFVLRASQAGHEVRWFRLAGAKPTKIGDGFPGFQMVDDWRSSMPWVGKDGLVFMTGNYRFLHELDRYREIGYRVFGPTVASANLEINREAGMKAMQAAGIDLPPYQTFDGFAAAERFARRSDRAWVFKPMGDEADKSLTYVSSDPADLVGWLRRQIAGGKVLKGKCMLQEKIDVMAEFGVSGWVGPEGFLGDKWQICIEHKKLMDGEVGPATGEMGTVCQYMEQAKLADEMLKPLESALRVLGHRGDFAIGAIIDQAGKAWPCEFTARCGWPAFFIQTASHKGDSVKWMSDLLDGKDTLRVSYDVAIGVVCAQPRFPYEKSPPELVEGNPIGGVEWPSEDVHPVSVMRAKGPVMRDDAIAEDMTWQTAGEYVLVCTALGKGVEKARAKVYRTVDRIRFPDKMFRRDIGEKVIDALPALHKAGYALDMRA